MFDAYKIKITFTRPILGSNPSDPDIHKTHIIEKEKKLIAERSKIEKALNKYHAAKNISDERAKLELESLEKRLAELNELISDDESNDAERGVTVFFRDKNNMPCIGDHWIYGFLKSSSESISKTLPKKNGTVLHSNTYTHGIINTHVRCDEQFISFDKDICKNEDGSPKYLVRSLRVMTAQGPRVSIAKSEQIEAGATISFTMRVMKDSPLNESVLRRLFDMGRLTGMSQWRNAGYGLFSYEMELAGNE